MRMKLQTQGVHAHVCVCVGWDGGLGGGWSANWITNELKVYNN